MAIGFLRTVLHGVSYLQSVPLHYFISSEFTVGTWTDLLHIKKSPWLSS